MVAQTSGKKRNPGRKPRKKVAPKHNEDRRSAGVVIMLTGLLLALWFIVIFARLLGAGGGVVPIIRVILAALGNIALALFIVYGGFAMYRERKTRLRFWQVLGWCFFALGILSLLQQNAIQTTFKASFLAALNGFGGGPLGIFPGYVASMLPSATAIGIVLWAFIILGLLLGTDFKVLKVFPWAYGKLLDQAQKPRPEKPEKPAKPALPNKETAGKEAPFTQPPLVIHYDTKQERKEEAEDLSAITIEEAQALARARQGEDSTFMREHMTTVGNTLETNVIPMPKKYAILENSPTLSARKPNGSEPMLHMENSVQPEKAHTSAEGDELPEEPLFQLPKNIQHPVEEEAEGDVAPINTGQYPPVYQLPPVSLLKAGVKIKSSRMNKDIIDNSNLLEQTLNSFGVQAKVVQVVSGPAVTRYELQPAPGVRVAKIANLSDDISLALAAKGVRIEAPVPGKSVVGIEVPKKEVSSVTFRDVIETETFKNSKALLTVALGLDISGSPIVADLAQMPHLLVAGATGSGKSVCINGLICSILFKAKPKDVKLVMIDPKKVELSSYAGLPHLARPVVTSPKKASVVLKEMVAEMERRYTLFSTCGMRNFIQYNESNPPEALPQILVIIDELADLMMVAAKDVEDSICRLAQMARAAGIHLVIATQRPSVDVITGLIKANIPSRIAFHVSSYVDSRTIIDTSGAEKLLGKGDMLFYPVGMNKPLRVQGAYISENEIETLVDWCSRQSGQEFIQLPESQERQEEAGNDDDNVDELFHDAVQQVIMSGQASASFLQRRFRIGYNRAARLVESMEQLGIVGPMEANKRQVLMSMEDFTMMFGSGS